MPECPLDVAAIVKLAARGDAWIEQLNGATRRLSPRENLELRAGELAITAAARLAAHTGAIGLVRDVRRWAELSLIPDEPAPTTHDLTEALALAVRAGVPPEHLEPLLADPDDWLVRRIASALDPQRASDLALLERLADDPRTEVAAVARQRLGPRYAWRWYAGIFEHDPLVTHADDPARVQALHEARTALGRARPDARPGEPGALVAALPALPPALAIPLLMEGLRVLSGEGLRDLVMPLYERGGLDAIVDTLRLVAQAQGDAERALMRAAAWCSVLPDPIRVELVARLLSWVEGEDPGGGPKPPPPEPGQRAPRDTDIMKGAARMVRDLWPPTLAPLPLLDWLLRNDDSFGTAQAIVKHGVDGMTPDLDPHAEHLQDLALAHPKLVRALPELFEHLGRTVQEPRLRAITEAFESSADRTLRTWALQQRTGRLAPLDPEARHALAEAWLDDPETCKAILSTKVCCARLLPWLRRRLRAQTLTLGQASTTLRAIGRLYGGVTEPASWGLRQRSSELEAAEERAEARAELGVWTDGPSGPPTAQEWASLRALTLEAIRSATRPSWEMLAVLPIGPWTREDLDLLDALEQRVLVGDELGAWLLHHFGELLHAKPPADAARRARRVLAHWADHPLTNPRFDLGKLRELAQSSPEDDEDASASANTEPSPAPAAASPPVPAPDWMDDEEELDP